MEQKKNYVDFRWYTHDVHCAFHEYLDYSEKAYLTEKDAMKVLESCHRHHNAEAGMNWDAIRYQIEVLLEAKEISIQHKTELTTLIENTHEQH